MVAENKPKSKTKAKATHVVFEDDDDDAEHDVADTTDAAKPEKRAHDSDDDNATADHQAKRSK